MNSNSSTSTTSTITSSHLIIYSLQSQSIIKEINDFGDEDNDDTVVVTCIKSNHKVIVLVKYHYHIIIIIIVLTRISIGLFDSSSFVYSNAVNCRL